MNGIDEKQIDRWIRDHREEMVRELKAWVSHPSVSRADLAQPGAPYGPACREMLDFALERASSCGFETEDLTKMFCDECGRRLEGNETEEEVKAKEENKEPIQKVCPSCGFRIFDAETMFCNDCGRRLVPESEIDK